MPLSEEQALDLLCKSYAWKERLQRAYRLGLLRGAEIVEPTGSPPCSCTNCNCGNLSDAESMAAWRALVERADAIRREAGEE